MARPEFPWAIDRRRLLTSAAAVVTATCIWAGCGECRRRHSRLFTVHPTEA